MFLFKGLFKSILNLVAFLSSASQTPDFSNETCDHEWICVTWSRSIIHICCFPNQWQMFKTWTWSRWIIYCRRSRFRRGHCVLCDGWCHISQSFKCQYSYWNDHKKQWQLNLLHLFINTHVNWKYVWQYTVGFFQIPFHTLQVLWQQSIEHKQNQIENLRLYLNKGKVLSFVCYCCNFN